MTQELRPCPFGYLGYTCGGKAELDLSGSGIEYARCSTPECPAHQGWSGLDTWNHRTPSPAATDHAALLAECQRIDESWRGGVISGQEGMVQLNALLSRLPPPPAAPSADEIPDAEFRALERRQRNPQGDR